MAQHIKNFLPNLATRQDNWKLNLLSNWPTIVGALSSRVCLQSIEHDTLVLGVYDACWMQELYMLSGLLIDTINKNLDQPRIKKLRFKRIMHRIPKNNALFTKESSAPVNIILTHSEQRALNTIKDEQLRKALEQFLLRCYKEKRS